jgi:hypothetical protein
MSSKKAMADEAKNKTVRYKKRLHLFVEQPLAMKGDFSKWGYDWL